MRTKQQISGTIIYFPSQRRRKAISTKTEESFLLCPVRCSSPSSSCFVSRFHCCWYFSRLEHWKIAWSSASVFSDFDIKKKQQPKNQTINGRSLLLSGSVRRCLVWHASCSRANQNVDEEEQRKNVDDALAWTPYILFFILLTQLMIFHLPNRKVSRFSHYFHFYSTQCAFSCLQRFDAEWRMDATGVMRTKRKNKNKIL